MPLREKEELLNYACLMFKPLDQEFEKTLVHVIETNKIRHNYESFREQMKDLKPYKVDITKLGKAIMFDDEPEEDEQAANTYDVDPRIAAADEAKPCMTPLSLP